jgi:hypothetical protein
VAEHFRMRWHRSPRSCFLRSRQRGRR